MAVGKSELGTPFYRRSWRRRPRAAGRAKIVEALGITGQKLRYYDCAGRLRCQPSNPLSVGRGTGEPLIGVNGGLSA